MQKLALFVEPASNQLNIFSAFTLPRLGSFILAGITNRRPGWRSRVFIEGVRTFDLQSWISRHGRPDLVGISTITATACRSYALADACRAFGIPVILGGPHATFLADEALEHAHLVVRGEGEKALEGLLDHWEDGDGSEHRRDYHDVPSLSWKDGDGRVHHNPLAPLLQDLDSLPFPDFSLADDSVNCGPGKRTVVVQTSRGCPFDCSFCSVTGMFGKKFRCRSVDCVMDEVRQYNHRDYTVFFCDDNFTASKQRAREMAEAILAKNLRFVWSTQVRADVARDPELVRLMRRAGCHTFFIGLESVNPRSLLEMNKRQTLEEIQDAVRIIQETGMHIHGMFVLGFDDDDWQTVNGTIEFARRMKLTSAQLLILTPLPGSELYGRLTDTGRITSRDWNLYDAHHVVFRPGKLNPWELQWAQIYGHTRLYGMLQGIQKLATGRMRAAAISFYARRINRGWQKQNREYLRTLAAACRNQQPCPQGI